MFKPLLAIMTVAFVISTSANVFAQANNDVSTSQPVPAPTAKDSGKGDVPRQQSSANDALWKLITISGSFSEDIFNGYNPEECRFNDDVEEVLRTVIHSPRSVTLSPLSIIWVTRFPTAMVPKEASKEFSSHEIVASENVDYFVVTEWDSEGKRHHKRPTEKQCVGSVLQLVDASLSRPTIDLVCVFKLSKNEPTDGDERSTILHAMLRYECDDGKWVKVNPTKPRKSSDPFSPEDRSK